MRYNLRIKIKDINFYVCLSRTQTLKGLCSLIEKRQSVPENIHICLWDLEGCTLKQTKEILQQQQERYDLSTIFILSDYPNSFRAVCFTQLPFWQLLKILIENPYLDYNFFYWTVLRSKATIRYSNKKNRKSQKIVAILQSDKPYIIPEELIFKTYDTGHDKQGHTLEFII